ncbi:MAG: low temperature requirement protein A [Clostridia bacterium]|nr:low temperature requirement protein A [Clostridia bacterium]MBQ3897445.1 low temperature requirement protein A [Clostridia bacterium]
MLFEKQEKKVEYIELIYDLIFVYIVGRNNSLLHDIENGFVAPLSFLTYLLATLAVIQIWNFSTFFINMFGRNGAREHIFIFINMYLLYYMGQGTREDWFSFQMQYHITWALILVNIAVQYILELNNHKADVWNRDLIKRMIFTLFAEAALVFAASFVSPNLSAVLSAAGIACGIALTAFSRNKSPGGQTDFAHLAERAMLYVVFTFGEMIIAVSSYFVGDGSFDMTVVYFSLMAFLIVVGLFLIYGFFYDRLLDTEGDFDGMLYMAVHIFIVLALNNITAALEFMREPEVALMPKIVFLVASVIAFFIFLCSLGIYTKNRCALTKKFIASLSCAAVIFILLMLLLRENMYLNIFVTVVFIFSVFLITFLTYRKVKRNA